MLTSYRALGKNAALLKHLTVLMFMAWALVSEPCRLTAPQQETLPGGTYTVLLGPERPSALHLPQLPWQAFEAVRSGPPPADWAEPSDYLDFTLPLDWGSGENETQENNANDE